MLGLERWLCVLAQDLCLPNPHGGLECSMTLVPGVLVPSSGLLWQQALRQCIYIHTSKTLGHIKIKTYFLTEWWYMLLFNIIIY